MPNKDKNKIDSPLYTHIDVDGYEPSPDEYQASKTPSVQKRWDRMTSEQEYNLVMLGSTPPLRNLLAEKDLDMTKIDPKRLEGAKILVDAEGIYHYEVMP